MRSSKLEDLVTHGTFDAEKGRDRPRGNCFDGLSVWYNRDKNSDLISDTGVRVIWRIDIAHADDAWEQRRETFPTFKGAHRKRSFND